QRAARLVGVDLVQRDRVVLAVRDDLGRDRQAAVVLLVVAGLVAGPQQHGPSTSRVPRRGAIGADAAISSAQGVISFPAVTGKRGTAADVARAADRSCAVPNATIVGASGWPHDAGAAPASAAPANAS